MENKTRGGNRERKRDPLLVGGSVAPGRTSGSAPGELDPAQSRGFDLIPKRAVWSDERGTRLDVAFCSPLQLVTEKHQGPVSLGHVWHFESGGQQLGPFAATHRSDDHHTTFEIVAPDAEASRALLNAAAEVSAKNQPQLKVAEEELGEHFSLEAFRRLGLAGTRARVRTETGARLETVLQAEGELHVNWADLSRADRVELPFWLEVDGEYTQYLFYIEKRDEFGRLVPPTRALRSHGRCFRRTRAPAGVTLTAEHPVFSAQKFTRPLVEVSLLGLAFECDHPSELLWPGLELSFTLEWKGGAGSPLKGVVRHVTRKGPTGWVCGLRVFSETPEAERFWENDVADLVYTTTRTAMASDLEPVWELYENSGYFNLSEMSTADFRHLKRSWERSRERLDDHPNLLTSVVRPGPKSMEGAIELCRFWPRSVIGFHMARRKDGRPLAHADNQPLRELHAHAYELGQRNSSVKWLVGYVQDVARFSRIIHHDFAERHVASGRAAIVRFQAIQVPIRFPLVGEASQLVRPPTEAEFKFSLEEIAKMRPDPYIQGLEMTVKTFQMTDFIAEWGEANCTRRRTMLISAGENGTPTAAIVLEAAEEGLHLFGLFDSARIYYFGDPDDAVTLSLIDGALAWFGALGKDSFVFLNESDAAPWSGLKERQAQDLGPADATFMSIDLAPEMLEFVQQVTFEQ